MKQFEENPRFLRIVQTHRQLFHFLRLIHGFEARKMKQLAVGTELTVFVYDKKLPYRERSGIFTVFNNGCNNFGHRFQELSTRI